MERVVKIHKTLKSKRKGDKVYRSEGYVVRFSLPKRYVERFGDVLLLAVDEESGEIRLRPAAPRPRGSGVEDAQG
ncbi:MAG: hypothetical protein GXO07_02950 [Crenarchaeota archaeon]|nr:hypothetical protein [Thermoproteota archaeon]